MQMLIDPARREEAIRLMRATAEKAERERAAAIQRSNPDRIALYAPFGIDTRASMDWGIGDYIVVKQYLLQPNYNTLPVRKVVAKQTNGEFVAIKISDLVAYTQNGTLPDDVRKTRHKSDWVKTKIQKGQFQYMPDPTVAGGSRLRGSLAKPATIATDAPQEQTAQQKRTIKNFMRNNYEVYVKAQDWNNRAEFASSRQPIVAHLVLKNGTGRSATYKVMNGRTGVIELNDGSSEQFARGGLVELRKTRLADKTSVSANDWVFVADHKNAIGYVCVVKNVTSRENRQAGLYIWTGEARPQLIQQPPKLFKVTEEEEETNDGPVVLYHVTDAANEGLILRFGEFGRD
jgi:hypothetical protein